MRPPCSVKNKGGNVMLIMKEILWTNNLNLAEVIPTMNLKFTVNAIILPVGGGGITFEQTFKQESV